MTFRRLVTLVTFLAVFTMAVRVSIDTDTWWHLRAGAWMVEHRQLLRVDPFSLTRQAAPWVYPGWLAQLLLYGVYQGLGLAGLNLLTAFMVTLAFALVWPLMEAPPLLRGFVLLLAATASGVYWAARPQILSFALTGLFVFILDRRRHGHPRLVWILPPIMALWANLHGGFAVGFLLIGAYLAGEGLELLGSRRVRVASGGDAGGEARRRVLNLALVGLVSAAAASLNPHGPVMLAYPFKTISIGVLQDFIQEWQSPDFHRLEAQPFLWMVLLTMLALAASRRRPSVTELLLVVGFSYMGFMAGRNVALFALVAAPVLARHANSALEPLLSGRRRGRQVPERLAGYLNLAIFSLLVPVALVKMAVPLSEEANQEAVRAQAPVAAVAFIRDRQPPGPLFNSYNWGGYVLWELYPDYLSFVDGRTDLFDDEVLNDYVQAWRADPGWEGIIDRWGIRLVLLEPRAPLARALEGSVWLRLYGDERAVVLVRDVRP
jgi:hypothetical protein